MLQGWDPTWTVRRIDAAAAIDGTGTAARHPSGISAVIERQPDGSLTLAALGPTDQIAASSRWTGSPVADRRGCLLIPGLVNAHTHLDLTHIGPQPHDPAGGFAPWIDMIRRERLTHEEGIAESVRHGITLALGGGTALVGDIGGAVAGKPSPIAYRAISDDGRINAVSYLEYFAQGERGVPAVGAVLQVLGVVNNGAMSDKARVVAGVQPHAPYSVGREYYSIVLARIDRSTPCCTHLAESAAEHEFIAHGTGPFRSLLEQLGVWDKYVQTQVGRGKTPIEYLDTLLLEGVTAVHCNDVSDEDLMRLADIRSPVIYCPRASAYFAAERDFGPHRYRDMLAAGITVALGTDSIVNLDTPGRISTWDEMRLLYQRDHADPVTLLKMATINGAAALRRETAPFTLTPMGTLAGLVAIPVPNANPDANPSELLAAALTGVAQRGGEIPTPELLAIGRV